MGQVALVGLSHLCTLDDAQCRVLAGGVQVDCPCDHDDANQWSACAGQGPCGRVPALHVDL